MGGGGQGEDQPVWSEGAQGSWALGTGRMRFFAGQVTEARLPFPLSLSGSFYRFLFLTIGWHFSFSFPDSASCFNNHKLMGMRSLSRKKKKKKNMHRAKISSDWTSCPWAPCLCFLQHTQWPFFPLESPLWILCLENLVGKLRRILPDPDQTCPGCFRGRKNLTGIFCWFLW